jgi:hypothetical protein
MPYGQVFQLVHKIQSQAKAQLPKTPVISAADLQANGKPEPESEAAPSPG